MLEFVTDEMLRDPHPMYAMMRDGAPVLHVPQAELWMLFGYDDVKRAMADPATFSSRAAPPGGEALNWLIFFDPPRHTKLRALVAKAFTPPAIAALEPRIVEVARHLLDQHRRSETWDLVGEFSVPLPLMVIAEMIGIPSDEYATFKRWSDAMLGLAETISAEGAQKHDASVAFGVASGEMREYLKHLLADRRRAPREDLLTRLLEGSVDGEVLTADEILGFFQLLLLAGNETTTNLISNAVLSLTENPEQLALLRAKPDLLPAAIEETLRFRSPVQLVFRQTTCDVEVGGQHIPADNLVLLVIGSANRDSAIFPNAEQFDVERDPNPHIAFGHGIHFCLGAPLARLEARIALREFFTRFEHFERAENEPWQPRKAFHVHGPTCLPIKVRSRAEKPLAGVV
jgi:cytochrome P450